MKQIEEGLTKIGLTKTEAKIYSTGLEYASVDVAELVKQTGLKRPTVYHALSTLIHKGLTAELSSGAKLKFLMCPPEQVKKIFSVQIQALKKQQNLLDDLVPILNERKKKTGQEKISVAQYEGIEGVKMVVDIALYCKSGHWDILAPEKNFFSEFDKEYAAYYLETRKKRAITSRSLWEKGIGRRGLREEEIRQRNPRFIPPSMSSKFQSVLILFDDKVAIISSLEKLSAILITSKETHDLFSAMFEGIWNIAEPYK